MIFGFLDLFFTKKYSQKNGKNENQKLFLDQGEGSLKPSI